MQYTLFLLLASISIAILVGVVLYASSYTTSSSPQGLVWLVGLILGWILFNSFELLAGTAAATLLWAKVSYPFIALTPIIWLLFALQYARVPNWRRPARFWVFLIIPLITVVLVWTNQLHGWMWASYDFVSAGRWLWMSVDHGPWFWVHVIYSYSLVGLGTLFIVRRHIKTQKVYRFQSRWLVFGAAIPILFNFVYILNPPYLQKDYTCIGFALSGLAFTVGMSRHRLFDLRPIARAALVDNMEDAMLVVDGLHRIIDLNPAARELLSRLDHAQGSVASPIGQAITDMGGDWPAFVDCVTMAETPADDIELHHKPTDRYYECSIVDLNDQCGRDLGRLMTLHDITIHKEAETALRYHTKELEASNEQLDAFAHTVAHDLKDPLNTLIGYGQMLDRYFAQMSKEEIKAYANLMVDVGQQMAKIIDALLLLARVYRLEDVTVDVLDSEIIVAEALARVKTTAMIDGAEVKTPDAWPLVTGYAPWVVEVWVNYLSNALKYTGPSPQIELGYEAAQDGYVRFWVRDHGVGLMPTQQEDVFKPFTRFHPDMAEGTGLGLTIVQHIVEKLDGNVGVESRPEHGCIFWFTLPGVDET